MCLAPAQLLHCQAPGGDAVNYLSQRLTVHPALQVDVLLKRSALVIIGDIPGAFGGEPESVD